MSSSTPVKIDVHHHFVPLPYVEALTRAGGDPSGWSTPQWSPESSLNLMSDIGVNTAILSITAPGVSMLDEDPNASCRLARNLNEYAASLRDAHPRKFGFFATLPSLLNTEAALEEVRHALDHLHAEGVCLYTRYGDGNYYLGHERLRPVWEELNARSAVVFVHPTHTANTPNLVNSTSPQPLYDYPHETTRAAMDLILSGTKRAYPACKIILSHAGGSLPYLTSRVSGMYEHLFPLTGIDAKQIEEDARSFYFDLALSGTPNILGLPLNWGPVEHILFGSDFSYAPRQTVVGFTKSWEGYEMHEEVRRKIEVENAWMLFPRLAEKD